MSNIEKIRQEIKRRKGYISVTHFAEELLSFIDSLPDEKPSEDLEEAAQEYAIPFNDTTYGCEYSYKGFIAGAKWQAKQGYSSEYIIRYAWGVSDTSTESKKATLSFPLPADIFEGDRVIIQIRKR